MKSKVLIKGFILGILVLSSATLAMKVGMENHCSSQGSCNKTYMMKKDKMERLESLSSKKMDKKVLMKKDGSLTSLSFSTGIQNFGGQEIKSFHLASGYSHILTLHHFFKPTLALRSSLGFSNSQARGSKSIKGFDPLLDQIVAADIQKEKNYQGYQFRMGLEKRYALDNQWELFSFAGALFIRQSFRFHLKSISGHQERQHFEFPKNRDEQSLGAFVGIGTQYKVNSKTSLGSEVEFAYATGQKNHNLLGSRISFLITQKL